jgi:integrase
MMRHPGVWRRGQSGAWYTTIGGRQVWLARKSATKGEARIALARLVAGQGQQPAPANGTLRDLLAAYLADGERRVTRGELAASTLARFGPILESCERAIGRTRLDRLTPALVLGWIDGEQGWGQSTRSYALQRFRVAVRWAIRGGLLVDDPTASLRLPGPRTRRPELPADLLPRLLAACGSEASRAFVEALGLTGARAGEVASVTAADFDCAAGTWTLREHKTARATGRPRVIYLPPAVVERCKVLAAERPAGPLYRTGSGLPWTLNRWTSFFCHLARKSGLKVSAHVLRHAWITDRLSEGLSPAIVAELVGHSGVRQISRVYGHLDRRPLVLADAVRGIGRTSPADGPAAPAPGPANSPDPAPRPAARSSRAGGSRRGGRR